MKTVNICEAKARLSQLVDEAAAGEDAVVSRNGRPLVRITRLASERHPITFGVLKDRVSVPADFDAPLHDKVVARFEAG